MRAEDELFGDARGARDWWQRAAEAGHAGAMLNLGLLLADTDPTAARHWMDRAAEAGRSNPPGD